MSRIAYVDGCYLPHREASVHIEDRGFQFADGVYEVALVQQGRLIDHDLHLARLARSLAALRLDWPVAQSALAPIIAELLRRNRLRDALVYLQITRGVARRDHAFPPPGTPTTLVVTARAIPPMPASLDGWQASAITWPDERWARCDIKSVSLLPNVLARQAARDQGATEAILIRPDGTISEGAATTIWIVDAQGRLRTRALGPEILPGCTRGALVALLRAEGMALLEGPYTEAELRAAREVMLTSATSYVKPITKLDGKAVGDGRPGPVAQRLFALFAAHVRQQIMAGVPG